MIRFWCGPHGSSNQEGKSKVGPDRVYAYPSDVVDDKLQIVDDSELLVSYPKIQLLTFCGPFRFSASMVLNYLRDVLVFNASKACGYPDRKKFRDRLNGIISSLPVEHVLKEYVKQNLMVEEATFLNSYSKLTEHFPQRSEAYVKRWKSRRSGQKQPKKPMKNPKNGELSPYSQTNLNRNACWRSRSGGSTLCCLSIPVCSSLASKIVAGHSTVVMFAF